VIINPGDLIDSKLVYTGAVKILPEGLWLCLSKVSHYPYWDILWLSSDGIPFMYAIYDPTTKNNSSYPKFSIEQMPPLGG